ncbi:MAG TPA: hypothetical protein VIN39_00705 [Candidatus Dormibacteraeota bacterium]
MLQVSPGAILSLLATMLAGVIFVMMVNETLAVGRGRDPVTNRVRAAVRAYPRISYVVAVVVGLVLGHLFWT